MKHDIPHDLEIALAKLAARKAAEAYAKRFAEYDYRHRWATDTRLELGFTVMGKRLEGIMEVLPRKLALELEVPFMFKVFQGKAISIIEREANEWIAKARRGELKEE
ncbi:polyhydroxyalkanoic acid system family protein [Nannocystaceae bacterium ST9]